MRSVVKGILLIGFTIQILLGLFWMGGNFGRVQGFGDPGSVLYGGILRLLGARPQAMYLLQLGAALFAGDFFLRTAGCREGLWRLWCGLALLSCPFALQCHLALLPFSFLGSLFLLLLSFLIRAAAPGKRASWLALAACCVALALLLSGALDMDSREKPGSSFAAAMASRFAWPTLWQDQGNWTEDLQEAVGEILWEASHHPSGMSLLSSAIEGRVGAGAADPYYWQIAEVGWRNHASMVIRQIGWDVLGYLVTPVIFPLQLAGEAYDSYTARNYEIMRENTPILTRNYVNYSCWWFCWLIPLTLLLSGTPRRPLIPAGICILCSGIAAGLLTMRGAGLMDYKYSAALVQLWSVPALLSLGGRVSR